MSKDSRGEPCPWGVSRDADVDDSPQPVVWIVDDGERHWVVARSPAEAIEVAALSFDMTVDEFVADGQPEVSPQHPGTPIRIHFDDPRDIVREKFPSGTRYYAEVRPADAAQFMKGMICSSVY